MLAKKFRFTTKNFNRVFRRNRKLKIGDYLFLSTDEKFLPKFGVVVSKKKCKSAVRRNRIRRQIYEIWRTEIADKIAGKSVICIFQKNENEFLRENFLRAGGKFLESAK